MIGPKVAVQYMKSSPRSKVLIRASRKPSSSHEVRRMTRAPTQSGNVEKTKLATNCLTTVVWYSGRQSARGPITGRRLSNLNIHPLGLGMPSVNAIDPHHDITTSSSQFLRLQESAAIKLWRLTVIVVPSSPKTLRTSGCSAFVSTILAPRSFARISASFSLN